MKEQLYFLLFVLQINLVFPQNFDFAAQINQQVQEQLQKNQQNMGDMIAQTIRQNLLPLQNIPISISETIRQQMLPIRNIGDDIRKNVKAKLLPIYAMNIKNSMKNGVGGSTVVTYDSGKVFIIENGARFTCRGNIVRGQCDNLKDPFHISSRQDYCYAPSFAESNDKVCLSTSSLNVENYNGQFSCRSSDGSEVLILTKLEYQAMCGNFSPSKGNYQYYANPNDPSAIQIPNPNPYVTCLNNEPNYCKFEDAGTESGTFISTNLNQNGGNSYSSRSSSSSYSSFSSN